MTMTASTEQEIQRHIQDRVPFDNPYPEDQAREKYHDFGLSPLSYTCDWPAEYDHAPPEPYIEFFWDDRNILWVLRWAYEDGVEGTSTMWPFDHLEDMEQKEIRNFLWQHEVEL